MLTKTGITMPGIELAKMYLYDELDLPNVIECEGGEWRHEPGTESLWRFWSKLNGVKQESENEN